MVPVRIPLSLFTKLTFRTCGMLRICSSERSLPCAGLIGSFEPFGYMRTSPWPSAPDLNSKMIEPDRPFCLLSYSPFHFPTRSLVSFFDPSTATDGETGADAHAAARTAETTIATNERAWRFMEDLLRASRRAENPDTV